MTIKEFFSFKTNKYFWLNIIAMIAVVLLILFVALKGLDVYTRHGEAVIVPNVKEMTIQEASTMLHNHGLEYMVADSNYVKEKPAGVILDLNPAAGHKVKEGRMIYLTVNTRNIPLRPVPDVADNSSYRQAQAKLLAAGFKLDEVQLVSGERDWVYGVKYQGRQLAAGEKVPVGAFLTLMVGSGSGEAKEDSIAAAVEKMKSSSPESSSAEDDSWF